MFLGAIYDFILVLLLTMGDNLSVKKMFFVPARGLCDVLPRCPMMCSYRDVVVLRRYV